MGIGWVIEIMILREILFASQMELYQNQERWQEVKQFYIAKAELNQFMKEINSGKLPSKKLHQIEVTTENTTVPFLQDLNLPSEGKVESPSQNGQMI